MNVSAAIKLYLYISIFNRGVFFVEPWALLFDS